MGLYNSFIHKIFNYFGTAFILISCFGLIAGVFEAAFRLINYQFPIRMALHFVFIPIGVYLKSLDENVLESENIREQTISLVAFCLVSVGSIGLNIGILELANIIVDSRIYTRMFLYAMCMGIGLFIHPFKMKQEIKND